MFSPVFRLGLGCKMGGGARTEASLRGKGGRQHSNAQASRLWVLNLSSLLTLGKLLDEASCVICKVGVRPVPPSPG